MSIEGRYAALLDRQRRSGYEFRFVSGGPLVFAEADATWSAWRAWGFVRVPFGFTGR